MLPMPAAPERPEPCRVHRFDGQSPTAVTGVKLWPDGLHMEAVDRKLYLCTAGCGFKLTMPLEA